MQDKRTPRFAEKFSKWLLTLAAVGAGIVLFNPSFEQKWDGGSFNMGGGAFSDEIRGAVVTLCIIGAVTALIRMWLPGNETPPVSVSASGSPSSTTQTTSTTTETK